MKRKDHPQDQRAGSRRASRRRRFRDAERAALASRQAASGVKENPVLGSAPTDSTPARQGQGKLRRRVLRRPDSPPSESAGGTRRPKGKSGAVGELDRRADSAPRAASGTPRTQGRKTTKRRTSSQSRTEPSRGLKTHSKEAPLTRALDPNAPFPAGRRRRLRLPRTIYTYIGIEVLRIAVLSVLAISLLGTVVLAFQLTRNGIRIGFLWPILQKSLAYPLYFSVPISLLFGVTLAIGRMASDLEVMAMRANGLSYRQIAAPVLIFASLLSAGAFYVNGEVIPKIHYAKGNLRDAILAQLESLGAGKNRSLLLPGQVRLFVEEYSGTRFLGIKLELQEESLKRLREKVQNQILSPVPSRSPGTSMTVLARSCDLEISADRREMYLNLQHVEILIPEPMRGRSGSGDEDVFRQKPALRSLRLPLTFLERSERVKDRSWSELSQYGRELATNIAEAKTRLGELQEKSQSASKSPLDSAAVTKGRMSSLGRQLDSLKRRSYRADTELYRRGAFSMACFTFPFVGLPLVLLSDRRSRLVPFFVGNVFVVLPFFLLVMLGVLLGERGLPPILTLAPANILLLAVGVHLWSRTVRK